MQKQTIGWLVAAVLLIVAYMHLRWVDRHACSEHQAFAGALDTAADEPITTRKGIRQVINEHKHRKRLGVRQADEFVKSVANGTLRGFIAGAMLGGGPAGMAASAASFGATSGVMHWLDHCVAKKGCGGPWS